MQQNSDWEAKSVGKKKKKKADWKLQERKRRRRRKKRKLPRGKKPEWKMQEKEKRAGGRACERRIFGEVKVQWWMGMRLGSRGRKEQG